MSQDPYLDQKNRFGIVGCGAIEQPLIDGPAGRASVRSIEGIYES